MQFQKRSGESLTRGSGVASCSEAWRFAHQKLLKPLDIVCGGLGSTPETGPNTLVVGECAARYAGLGVHLEGCPPTPDALIGQIECMGCVCLRCRELVREASAGRDAGALADLRISAAGAEVYAGARVERGKWHRELVVGDCMARYARIVTERAGQFGLDSERDIVWLEGCPARAEEIQRALRHWEGAPAPAVP